MPRIDYRVVKGGGPRGGGSLIFPKLPQSSRAGILRVPQEHPLPFKNPTILSWCRALVFLYLEDHPMTCKLVSMVIVVVP